MLNVNGTFYIQSLILSDIVQGFISDALCHDFLLKSDQWYRIFLIGPDSENLMKCVPKKERLARTIEINVHATTRKQIYSLGISLQTLIELFRNNLIISK
jgi:hypothetical protein